MTGTNVVVDFNEAKADMDHIYDRPDPRAYFSELQKLDYAIPGHAQAIFGKISDFLQAKQPGIVKIVDLGCSYGVNAALLKYDVSLSELYKHWTDERLKTASPREVIDQDRRYFRDLGRRSNIRVVGVDQAAQAVTFGEDAGLLDQGIAINLEEQLVPAAAQPMLAGIDLVISTGCIGYVTERTFERLLPVVSRDGAPWMAHFVLRQFPYDAIAKTLSRWGYVTEKLEDRTFVQRRFASAAEQRQSLAQLRQRGIDPAGKEAAGHLHAELYLSRPADAARALPLAKLLAAP